MVFDKPPAANQRKKTDSLSDFSFSKWTDPYKHFFEKLFMSIYNFFFAIRDNYNRKEYTIHDDF